ncbi:DUF401 family protein [Archaeoglobus veneficus]|uniref:DUF401 family protein n=1 Tax=Archaeoglobus veneficus (strain DSM 11195 / SNP6) TaxID=693661 RepID=F2KMQ6_ARCVS|nr:DUF401 family protein [Archaeoglobus veneficus]AEA46080.1 protein of unknown function DUF401 [Archaeoglobus veneficus SNP6]
MDTSIALFISILLILLLIRAKINISLSIFAGAITLGLLSVGLETFEVVIRSSTSPSTLRLLILVTAAFTLGYSMEYLKLLENLQHVVERMTGKFSVAVLPLIVGLLPMPGGALISAVMIRDLVKKYGITVEEATYINYWFRHVWVTVWPLYPNLIIASAVVETSVLKLVLATYPIGLAAFFFALLSARNLGFKWNFSLKDFFALIASAYPILLVALLAIALRIDMLVTLLLSLAILYIHKRVKPRDIVSILRRTVDVKIILLIFAVMAYKDLIVYTNSAEVFFSHLRELNFPPSIAVFAVSFLVGFATGIELSYSSVALPLLVAFTGVGDGLIAKNLMLAIAGGFLGVMVSPMHLCFALTCEYFRADVEGVYRLLIPSVIGVAVIVAAFFLL